MMQVKRRDQQLHEQPTLFDHQPATDRPDVSDAQQAAIERADRNADPAWKKRPGIVCAGSRGGSPN